MLGFKKLNETNGFDETNLNNAKQNNYAWSMAEFGDYIYVGTGRNITAFAVNLLSVGAQAPLLIKADKIENNAEIWRFKKDETKKWERVYQATSEENIAGFRYMVVHASKNSTPALYAASFAFGENPNGVTILKTTDGSNWTRVGGYLEGGSSRAMVSFNGKLYVSTIDAGGLIGGEKSYLYVSEDPEFSDFELVLDYDSPEYIEGKNPIGGIDNIAVFNNKLYLGVGSSEGLEVWRSNDDTPRLNEWTRVIDKGFGEGLNKNSLAMGVYKDHLYITSVKTNILILIMPLGFGAEVVRIDKNDKWELVVGGKPIQKTETTTGKRTDSISGYGSGFSNSWNIYVWQIREFKNMLFATTFDHGSDIEVLRDIALKNKDVLVNQVGEVLYNLIVKLYDIILGLFKKIEYPRGFDMYMSTDGINFKPISLDGLGNGNNYGGRILMVSSDNELYVGTSNPYQGCEVLKSNNIDTRILGISTEKNKFGSQGEIEQILDEIEEQYSEIIEYFLNNNKMN